MYRLRRICTSHLQGVADLCGDSIRLWLVQSTEAEFVDVIGTKVLRVFLLANHRHFYINGCYSSPPPPEQKGFENWFAIKTLYTETSGLSRLCPETSTKLYVHEFGFWTLYPSVTHQELHCLTQEILSAEYSQSHSDKLGNFLRRLGFALASTIPHGHGLERRRKGSMKSSKEWRKYFHKRNVSSTPQRFFSDSMMWSFLEF
jgi:hypothetical protein